MLRKLENGDPLKRARLAGAFYLLTIVSGVTGLFLHGKSAMAAELVAGFAYMVVTLLFYYIFKPVNGMVSFVAATFSVLGFLAGAFSWKPWGINGLVFFGIYCLLIAYLIFQSSLLPHVLAYLMAFAGLNWLTYLSPYLEKRMYPYNLFPGLIGEGALTVWLLVRGVRP